MIHQSSPVKRHLVSLVLGTLLLVIVTFRAGAAPAPALTETPTPVMDATPEATPETTAEVTQAFGSVEQLVPQVLATYPHDTNAFTEGLLWHDGTLYESTGRYGDKSNDLRQVDLTTGSVLRKFQLSDEFYGEGLALVDDRLIQLTWKNDTAFVYDLKTFDPVGTLMYTGEGWGLCYDGKQLYMSDGSNLITVRDPKTFQPTRQLSVTLEGVPVLQVNELECVGDSIYSNVWLTDTMLRIDKATGVVTGYINAANLRAIVESSLTDGNAVLNGIAYNPDTDTFYVTGKMWPKLFEVRFVPKS